MTCRQSLMLLAVLMAAVMVMVRASPQYMRQIPNGSKVPYPCKPGQVWHHVGHLNTHPTAGHPNNNQFGLDFQAEGHRWTTKLCHMDSDKDGKTNGQELGDPHCHWRVGQTPQHPASGHPGFDESDCTKFL